MQPIVLPEEIGGDYAPDITHVAVNDGGKWVHGFLCDGRFFPRIAGGAESGGDGDGDGTGDDGDGDEESDDGDDDAGDGEGEGKGKEGEKGGKPPKKTYTLTEDRLKSRLERQSASALRTLARELGYDSVDAMKDAAKAAKESTDTEKRDLPKAESRIKELEAENKKLSASLRGNSIRITVEREAAKMGFVDPEDAFRLGDFGDDSEFVGTDDKIDTEAVREALEELAGRKKHLIKASVRRKGKGDDSDEDDDEDDDEGDDTPRSRREANRNRGGGGGSPGRGGNGTARKAANEESLKKRFPIAYGGSAPRA